jgi:hypothetical protein
MLTLSFGNGNRDCSGLTRRNFLRTGALGLGGFALPQLLRASGSEASFIKDKTIVMVFLAGGMSHIESFNPNMDGTEAARSITGEVKTDVPGITLGGTFEKLAKHIKKGALVHSFRHPIGNHEQAISHVLTGGTDANGQAQAGSSLGSMYARCRGANHEKTGIPTYALLTAPHKDGQYSREMSRVQVGSRAGALGAGFEPFVPTGKGPALENMQLRLPAERLDDRRELLKQLDGLKSGLDGRDTGYGQFEYQAMELIANGAGKAFDLTKEPKTMLEKYDTSEFKCGKKVFEPSILGKQFLMARRLIEAGCGFITVQSAGWDMHADGNNPAVKEGMEMLGRPLDKALSAFLEDLQDRGLLEKTLVVVTGDFGRTPKFNKNGGRDHWANLCTLALFGGGIRGGQIIGKSAKNNDVPATDPYHTGHLFATLFHHAFDVGTMRVARGVPTTILNAATASKIIDGLW